MSKGPTVVVKVGRKGVIVIPKALRELVGIEEKSLVILGVEKGKIVIKPLKVVRVEATKKARRVLEEALSEEYRLEEEKARRIIERK
ncbi:MAG: AbrB family transcriptional regulator [Thermoprotei archaeon]|nr:MAG: AbrB family transcriptional regulator [Thermoprotei archaeon]